MRKLITALLMMFAVVQAHAAKMEKLVFTGPFTAVSYPLIHMVETNSMKDFADKTEFQYWQNPDQLRAMIAGKQAHFAGAPSYVGAMFYNKGIPLKMMNVSVWGILHVISTDKNVKTFKDMKGKEVVVPFRGEMPDLIFRHLAVKNGINPETDYKLTYVPHPMDVAHLLLSGRAEHAMTAEPAVAMTVGKSMQMAKEGKSKPVYKVINLQEEWAKIYSTKARIAQAGTLAMPSVTGNTALLKKFEAEFEKSAKWVRENPEKAAEIIVKYLPQTDKQSVVAGIINSDIYPESAGTAKDEIELFFKVVAGMSPEKLGGKLPDGGLYYNVK